MNPSKPILIYDGDCGFCRRWIERWRNITGDRVEYASYQEVAQNFPMITEEEFKSAVQLVEPVGKIYRAAEAVFRSLATAPSYGWLLWIYSHFPGARTVAECFYDLVAKNRTLFSKISYFFWGDHVGRSTYLISGSFFIRFIGLIYLIAFASLGTQILGLIGSNGILPAHDLLSAIQSQTGTERFWLLPTLAWLNSSDRFLLFLCWAGASFSVFVLLEIGAGFFLFLNWLFYLSLFSIGSPFLSFQWDTLLLETGFLAIFFAALGKPDLIRFLLKFLVFKLTFSSGWVKLASHDASWKNLTALRYHFETQPLPVWTSWYVHHLPGWFLTAVCFLVFVIELIVPFFIFLPRRIRHFATIVLIGFQILIFLTGNYTFFNWLTIALCLLLLDDIFWPEIIGSSFHVIPAILKRGSRHHTSLNRFLHRTIVYSVTLVVLLANLGMILALEPLHLASHYGLFAVMTTERPEIIVEGSRDGEHWLAYKFKYKPGDVKQKPAFVEPHQPRLDWQMWFAALGNWRHNRWFIYFCQKLLNGSPDVLKLLGKNPFSEAPPRYIRAVLYDYYFTTRDEKRKTGAWWRREPKGLYCPVISLKD